MYYIIPTWDQINLKATIIFAFRASPEQEMKIQRKRRRELQPSSHTLYTVERRERPRSPGMAMHGYGSCHGVLLSGTPAPA
jgi:hypothetical protein